MAEAASPAGRSKSPWLYVAARMWRHLQKLFSVKLAALRPKQCQEIHAGEFYLSATQEEAAAVIPGAGKAPASTTEAKKIATSAGVGEERLLAIVRTASKRVAFPVRA